MLRKALYKCKELLLLLLLLKVAQFHGKHTDLATLHPTRAAGVRFNFLNKIKGKWYITKIKF